MKEEDYKKLRCCGPCPSNTGNPIVEWFGGNAVTRYLCSGPECAAWQGVTTAFKDGEECVSKEEIARRYENGEYRVLGCCGLIKCEDI